VNNLNNNDVRDINLVSRPRFSGVIYSEMWLKINFPTPLGREIDPRGSNAKILTKNDPKY